MVDPSNESQVQWVWMFFGVLIGRCVLLALGVVP